MASFDLPELPQTRMSPQLLMGATSPLWTYFGVAAAGGVAYWWMTQWARPVNLEAMLGEAKILPAPAAVAVASVVAAVEPMEDVLTTAPDALIEAAPEPVGGEAAPVSAMLEIAPVVEPAPQADAAPEAPAEATPEPLLGAEPEPVIEEPAPFAAETAVEALEPAAKPRAKKPPPIAPEG
jgi:hypothetical protein